MQYNLTRIRIDSNVIFLYCGERLFVLLVLILPNLGVALQVRARRAFGRCR